MFQCLCIPAEPSSPYDKLQSLIKWRTYELISNKLIYQNVAIHCLSDADDQSRSLPFLAKCTRFFFFKTLKLSNLTLCIRLRGLCTSPWDVKRKTVTNAKGPLCDSVKVINQLKQLEVKTSESHDQTSVISWDETTPNIRNCNQASEESSPRWMFVFFGF